MAHLLRTWALAVLMACASVAPGQDGWQLRRFTANDGLPQNTVRSMAFDERGYLWMTTEGGLVRYDGLNFRTLSRSTDPVVVEDRMRHLIRSAQGDLYVNDGAQSLYRLEGGRLFLVVDGNTLAGNMGSLAGTFPSERLYPDMVTEALAEAGFRTYSGGGSVVIAFDTVKWAVHGHKLIVKHTGPHAVVFIPVNGLPGSSFQLQGALYVLDQVQGMQRLDAEGRTLRAVPVYGQPEGVLAFHWGAYPDVVLALTADTLWRVVPHADGLAFDPILAGLPKDAPVLSVASTPDGNTVFVGTANKGLYRYDRQWLKTISIPMASNTQESVSTYAVLPFSDSTVLMNMGWEVGEGVKRLTSVLPISADRFALHRDNAGNIWSIRADTLVKYDVSTGGGWVRMVVPFDHVSSIMQQADTLWVAGVGGVAAYVDDRMVLHVRFAPSGPLDRSYDLCMGPGGTIWSATTYGVLELDPRTGAVSSLVGTGGLHARALHREGDRMFLGTYGQGVHVYEAGTWKQLPFDQSQGCTHVHSFIPDTLGWIWMPTNKGLFRMERNALDRWLAEGAGSVELASHGEEEGAATAEFNGGCTPAYAQLANGMVVLPSMEGLVWFAPERMPYPWPRGAVHVDRVEVDGKPVDHTSPLPRLTAGAVLATEVSMVFWGAPHNRIWRYRLAGHGPPQIIGPEGRIVVERLPAGEHALEVMLPDGSTRTVLRFVVTPPWYLRWWALLAMAAVLILLGAMVSGMRQRRIMKANLELEARIAQRTADLSRSNEQLGRESRVREQLVRILSHDIVAPLKAIARLGRQGIAAERQWPEQELRAAFSDMAAASDTLHGDASELLEWIKRQGGNVRVSHEHVALHDHVARVVERSREAARQEHVQVVNAVAEELVVCTDPQLLGIVLQNILSNAIRHAPGCRVYISARETDDGFVLEVADHGPGMSPAALERIRTLLNGEGRDTELRSGLGYMIIADIAALLNARVEVESDGVHGTRVVVEVHGVELP